MSAAIAERAVTAAGVRSPLLEAGPRNTTEAVVFLHGNPGSARDWADLLGRAGELARAVAFDLPGFGGCPVPDGFRCSVEDYAGFVDAVLAALAIERAHLVVHDFGGVFGFAWAADNPEQVGSVVAINTGLLRSRRWHAVARLWRRPVVGELVQLLVTRRRFEEACTAGGELPLPDDFVERMWRDYDWSTRRTVLRLYCATETPYPTAERWMRALRELDPPALIVWGERDTALRTSPIKAMREAMPSAELVMLPGSGHFPFADDPEGTAAAVIPFLRQQVGDGSPS